MSAQQTAPTRYLTADNIDFAYRQIGENTNNSPPLLLLNHVRSNIDLWDPYLINNFTASGRQVITYDYAGQGHSGGEVATSIKTMAVHLLAFLNGLLPMYNASHVDVLGFSMGRYVAQQLTLDAPSVVNNLILAGTGPSLGPDLERPQATIQSAIMSDPPIVQAATLAFFPSIAYSEGEAWINRSFSSRAEMAGKDGEPKISSFQELPGLANLTEAYLGWDADPVPYAMLQTIQKNVLITAGQNDLIIPPKNSWVLARQLPRAHMIQYAASGHGHIFQYASDFVQRANEFLDGTWPLPPFSAGPSPASQSK